MEDTVLVVDDDQATRDSLASVLKGAGIEVFVASDPTEALTLRGLQRPGAVVVDHQLAEHTGVELAQRLKQEDPETPVLLLTGLASLDSALAASSQLDGLLVKPLVPQAFIQTVRNALAQRALTVENQRLAERIEQLQSQATEATRAAEVAQAAASAAAERGERSSGPGTATGARSGPRGRPRGRPRRRSAGCFRSRGPACRR